MRHLMYAMLAASAVMVSGWSSCGPDILADPSFDLWCGESLCAWEVEAGEVERVATWHGSDAGVGLVGDEVVISQLSTASSGDAACLGVSLLADVADDAAVTLELDFLDDGTAEYSHAIVADDWEQVQYTITPPDWWTDLRFRLRKVGGEASLAQIRVQAIGEEDCLGDAVELHGRPDGAECAADLECAGGHCTELAVVSSWADDWTVEVCSSCSSGDDCDDGACGLDAGELELSYLTCSVGDKALGEACALDDECGSGTCCEGQCSECCEGEGCEVGSCERRPAESGGTDLMPHMCSPAAGERATGEACVDDSDCASGTCDGADLKICDPDGRSCEVDEDCPWAVIGAACSTVGVLDGTCL